MRTIESWDKQFKRPSFHRGYMDQQKKTKKVGPQTMFVHARWAPTSYEWGYDPYKWPYKSGQIITTSAEVTLNGGLVRESPPNPLNSGLGIILICPDKWVNVVITLLSRFNPIYNWIRGPPCVAGEFGAGRYLETLIFGLWDGCSRSQRLLGQWLKIPETNSLHLEMDGSWWFKD